MHVNYTRILSFSDIAYTCYSTNCLLDCLPSYVSLQVLQESGYFCPDPKGPLSDHSHLPTALITEANKEVFTAVAEAKEPQKKGPYIKFTPEYRAKVAKFASILMEIASYSKGIVVVAYVTKAVQHFCNKTGRNNLVNVISPYRRVDCKGFYFQQLRRHCTCSIPRFYMLESTCFDD